MRSSAAWSAGLLAGVLLTGCAGTQPLGASGTEGDVRAAPSAVRSLVTPLSPAPSILARPDAPPPPSSLTIMPGDAGAAEAYAEDGVVTLSTGLEDDAASPGRPVRVDVPRLGITSRLDSLGLEPSGVLQAPPRWERAGWFAAGPRPGDRGPAVIAGHLDSPTGAAVFAALPQMRRGDRVLVADDAGVQRTFEVTLITRTPKQGFPTRQVYGAVPGPELRLITCSGEYVPEAGGYQDNLLVFARMVQ